MDEVLGVQINSFRASPEVLGAIVDGQAARGRTLRQWFKKLGDDRFGRLEQAVRLGLLEGETTPQIIRRLMAAEEITKRSAAALVRTSITSVATQARQAFYSANRDVIKGVRWVSTLDGRTSAICQSRDNKEYPVDSGPRPPAHPTCRSTIPPIVKGWDELAADGGLNLKRGSNNIDKLYRKELKRAGFSPSEIPLIMRNARASMSGPVKKDLSYEQWLRRQPKEFQDDVLGRTRAELFRKGGLTLDSFVDQRSGKQFSLAELAKRETAAWNTVFGTLQDVEADIGRRALAAAQAHHMTRLAKETVERNAILDQLDEIATNGTTWEKQALAAQPEGLSPTQKLAKVKEDAKKLHMDHAIAKEWDSLEDLIKDGINIDFNSTKILVDGVPYKLVDVVPADVFRTKVAQLKTIPVKQKLDGMINGYKNAEIWPTNAADIEARLLKELGDFDQAMDYKQALKDAKLYGAQKQSVEVYDLLAANKWDENTFKLAIDKAAASMSGDDFTSTVQALAKAKAAKIEELQALYLTNKDDATLATLKAMMNTAKYEEFVAVAKGPGLKDATTNTLAKIYDTKAPLPQDDLDALLALAKTQEDIDYVVERYFSALKDVMQAEFKPDMYYSVDGLINKLYGGLDKAPEFAKQSGQTFGHGMAQHWAKAAMRDIDAGKVVSKTTMDFIGKYDLPLAAQVKNYEKAMDVVANLDTKPLHIDFVADLFDKLPDDTAKNVAAKLMVKLDSFDYPSPEWQKSIKSLQITPSFYNDVPDAKKWLQR